MAKNLRAKLPATDTLIVQDVNLNATKQFLAEHSDGVIVADTVREVAEKSASIPLSSIPPPSYDEHPFLCFNL
jgi:3-hydroxyisobutyrate dehydrogenase